MTEMHKQIDLWNKSRKRCQKGSVPHLEWEPFWDYLPSKMPLNINAKVDGEKAWKFMRNCFQNDAKTTSKINDKSMKFRNLRFLVFCEEYNVKIVFSHDQESQKSIKNQ